jgi:negative regulator of sigma E activity
MENPSKPIRAIVTLGWFVLALLASKQAEAEDAHELVKKVLDAVPKIPFVAEIKVMTDQGWVRTLGMKHKKVGDAQATYLEVTSPEELKDTRFLFFEREGGRNDQYVKVAASRQAIQVSEKTRTHPFLGSEFFVSDLVPPELDAFTYRFMGEEEIGGRQCRLVEAKPKDPKKHLYSKTILALDPNDLLVLRREFFDSGGNLFKVWSIEKVEKIDGYWTLLEQRMTNVKEKRESTLKITKVQYNAELEDRIFDTQHLLR